MMDNGVIEVVVNTKPSGLMKFLKVLFIILAILFLLFTTMTPLALIPVVAFAILAWYVSGRVQFDYEYALVDRELRVARIANKQTRKHLATYDLDKMEILAPEGSYHLDDYKNHRVEKDLDYSDHLKAEEHPAGRYILYIEPNTRIRLTLTGEEGELLLGSVRQFAPRKVFLN